MNMTSLSKLLLVTAAMFSLAGKCEVDDGKFWYNLNEVPTAPADKPFIMDYNSDGEIDVRDAIFVGKDRNFDGNLEHIQIYRFRGFTLYKNGQHRYVDFKMSSLVKQNRGATFFLRNLDRFWQF